MLTRRTLLMAGTTAALAPAWGTPASAAPKPSFEVTRSDAEWRRLLTPEQYAVLRQEDTEVAGSSPLNAETRKGAYRYAGCDGAVYASDTKFESGTGWPSFYAPLDKAVGTRVDRKLVFMTRTEVHCRRCGGHLGHVFDDGPPPTGERHCLNGVALKFVPLEA